MTSYGIVWGMYINEAIVTVVNSQSTASWEKDSFLYLCYSKDFLGYRYWHQLWYDACVRERWQHSANMSKWFRTKHKRYLWYSNGKHWKLSCKGLVWVHYLLFLSVPVNQLWLILTEYWTANQNLTEYYPGVLISSKFLNDDTVHWIVVVLCLV